ncbi:hypothetical protein ACWCY6_17705 [Streptomyces sp. 900105755]
MAGWISSAQQKRDNSGQRDICAADGRPGTEEDPPMKANDGFRVHLSDTTDPNSPTSASSRGG